MRKLAGIVGLILVLVMSLSACGPKSAELTITMTEYKFEPNTFEIPASAEVTLTLINDGTLEHELVIMNFEKYVTTPFDDDDEPNIYWEHELEAAASDVLVFNAPGQPGEYQIVCGIPEHLEQGMEASLTVK
jgi:uncharacterized cupredoxin-like copper-binding protein